MKKRPPIWTILPVVLSGCETWSFTLREESRLRVFENRVLRRIYGPKRDGVTGEWRRIHREELNDLYCSANTVRLIESRRRRWAGHVWGRTLVHTRFWRGNLNERDHLEDQGIDGRILLKCICRKLHGAWTGLIWLRIRTSGELL